MQYTLFFNQVLSIPHLCKTYTRIRINCLYPYKCHITSLEKIQCRAGHFVCNNHSRYNSVTNMKWPSLEQRRKQAKCIMFYKIINNMVFFNFHQYLQPAISSTQGHHLKFAQLQARVDVSLHSFLPLTVRLWISLPAEVVTSLAVDDFKNIILNS